MEIKSVSDHGVAFLTHEEGIVLHPYKDSVDIPTIGIGCTYYETGQKIKMTDPPITKERAISLFRNLLKHYELAVYSYTRDDINQNQFDALVSICFNIGTGGFKSSTLLRRVNANPNDPAITAAFKMWKKPIVLLARRIKEANLYFAK
jgi:lysozyme